MDRSPYIERYGGPPGIVDDWPALYLCDDQFVRAPIDPAHKAHLIRIQPLRHLTPDMSYYQKEEGPDVHEFDPSKTYTGREMELMADQLLREDANETDEEGRRKGIKGENPILFAEHIRNRQSREIGNKTGIPEPGIVRGIYNRTHPEGRKVNSDEARTRHGASYYR